MASVPLRNDVWCFLSRVFLSAKSLSGGQELLSKVWRVTVLTLEPALSQSGMKPNNAS